MTHKHKHRRLSRQMGWVHTCFIYTRSSIHMHCRGVVASCVFFVVVRQSDETTQKPARYFYFFFVGVFLFVCAKKQMCDDANIDQWSCMPMYLLSTITTINTPTATTWMCVQRVCVKRAHLPSHTVLLSELFTHPHTQAFRHDCIIYTHDCICRWYVVVALWVHWNLWNIINERRRLIESEYMYIFPTT